MIAPEDGRPGPGGQAGGRRESSSTNVQDRGRVQALSGVISVARHAESGAITGQLQPEGVQQPAGPVRPRPVTHSRWSEPPRRNPTVVQKNQPRQGTVPAIWGSAEHSGLWTAPDLVRGGTAVPLDPRRVMIYRLVPGGSAAAVVYGASSGTAAPMGRGGPSALVPRLGAVDFSQLPVRARRLLKGKDPRTASWQASTRQRHGSSARWQFCSSSAAGSRSTRNSMTCSATSLRTGCTHNRTEGTGRSAAGPIVIGGQFARVCPAHTIEVFWSELSHVGQPDFPSKNPFQKNRRASQVNY